MASELRQQRCRVLQIDQHQATDDRVKIVIEFGVPDVGRDETQLCQSRRLRAPPCHVEDGGIAVDADNASR